MPGKNLSVISICGSLRSGSYNGIVQRALPALAPEGLMVRGAPSFADFPLYNADVQAASGFPARVNALADAIRAADGVIIVTPEYNFSIPGGLKNAIDWVSRLPNQPFAGKPIALQSASPGPLGGGRVQYDLRRAMCFWTPSCSTNRKSSSVAAPRSSTRRPARSRTRPRATSSSSSLPHLQHSSPASRSRRKAKEGETWPTSNSTCW